MSEATWGLGIALLVVTALAIYFAWRARNAEREELRITKENDALAADFQRARERADLHERRANEFFAIIEGVEGEAQTWRKMFGEGMSKAGAAQNWLVRDLSEMTKVANIFGARLRALKEKAPTVQVSPQLRDFIAEFEQDGKAEVAVAPGKSAADLIETELRGPAALNAPVEVPSESG